MAEMACKYQNLLFFREPMSHELRKRHPHRAWQLVAREGRGAGWGIDGKKEPTRLWHGMAV